MRERELPIDRSCHVVYSRRCRALIRGAIARHYPEGEREAVWEQVQRQYVEYLSQWRTDLGGKRNFHNGAGGTYDCIALMCYFKVCREVTDLPELEALEGELFLPAFRRLRFVDVNRPFWRKLLYRAFASSQKKCERWHDYEMHVEPWRANAPIRYDFTACPVADFARQFGLLEAMPALCNVDYAGMELIRARLVRTTTCAGGDRCDYAICGDRDPFLREHPEYRDAQGYRRNR